jgi:phosphohistidine phosphatase SixA
LRLNRRAALRCAAAAALPKLALRSRAATGDAAAALVAEQLSEGGCVIAFRHALAPGAFDPPSFQLSDCSTQRNLNEEGRSQAGRIGAWFQRQSLTPSRVRSSPWCRCIDTALLAFNQARPWPALGSPYGANEATYEHNLRELRRSIADMRDSTGRFEVWVTHMFVLADLVHTNTSSGEGLVLRANASGVPTVLGRLLLA